MLPPESPSPDPPDPDETGQPTLEPVPTGMAETEAGVPTEPVARGPGSPTPEPTGRRPSRLTIVSIALAIVAVLAGTGLFLSGYSIGRMTATTPGTPASEADLFQPFWDTYRSITERYAGGPVDRQTLVQGAIKGMIDSLGDPYSYYLTPEQYRQGLEGINGQFEGIGAEIGTVSASGQTKDCTTLGPDCRLVIIAPLDGSPAQRAGVRAGDLVVATDDKTLDGLTVGAARDRIRGPRGTQVRLTIERAGTTLEIPITRDVIQQSAVSGKALAGGAVGYLRVSGFSSDAARDFDNLLRADLAKGQRRLVLDLRGNPGGFVDAARDIASQFIASGPIFWQEDSRGVKVETDALAGGAATDPSIQVVVLVDKGSASASEIVAGALQDHGRAKLVGEQTFGKGTVQEWNQLEGADGGFRLTIAKWLTPKQTWIHQKGLTPDIKVAPAPAGATSDPILDRALEVLGAPAALAPAA